MFGGSLQKWWDVHGARRESACSPPQHRNTHGKLACRSLTISYSPFPCKIPQFRPAPSVQEVACIASGPDEGRNEGILSRNRGSQAGDPGLRRSVKERQSLLEWGGPLQSAPANGSPSTSIRSIDISEFFAPRLRPCR